MSRMLTREFLRVAALGLVASLCLAGSAHALFPPPYFYPTGGVVGVPDPPPPPPVPPPETPPPCECCCCTPPTHASSTPEPTTMISALVGPALLGGYAKRRRA